MLLEVSWCHVACRCKGQIPLWATIPALMGCHSSRQVALTRISSSVCGQGLQAEPECAEP